MPSIDVHTLIVFLLDLMMNYATSKNEGGISNKGRGLSKIWDLLTTAFNANVTEEDLEKLYKVITNIFNGKYEN